MNAGGGYEIGKKSRANPEKNDFIVSCCMKQ